MGDLGESKGVVLWLLDRLFNGDAQGWCESQDQPSAPSLERQRAAIRLHRFLGKTHASEPDDLLLFRSLSDTPPGLGANRGRRRAWPNLRSPLSQRTRAAVECRGPWNAVGAVLCRRLEGVHRRGSYSFADRQQSDTTGRSPVVVCDALDGLSSVFILVSLSADVVSEPCRHVLQMNLSSFFHTLRNHRECVILQCSRAIAEGRPLCLGMHSHHHTTSRIPA